MSLAYELEKEALKGFSTNGKSEKDYRRIIRRSFVPWAKENGIKRISQVTEMVIQNYADHLLDKGKSPNTIHTYIAPICKAVHIDMDRIEKPKRNSGSITRGRGGKKGERGRKEAEKERNARIVTAARAIGIRKDEYRRLRGRDLIEGKDGYLYVFVSKGKGGKRHWQRILPSHEAEVRELFKGIAPKQHVFTREEIKNAEKINIHGYRAELAKEAYTYYANRIATEPGYREVLKGELLKYFEEENIKSVVNKEEPSTFNAKAYEKAYRCFCSEMERSEIYHTRTDNKNRCIEKGLPTEYDRVALLAASVFHLSHWRTNVAVTNYVTA